MHGSSALLSVLFINDVHHVIGPFESLCKITLVVSTVVRLSIFGHARSAVKR